MLNFPKPEWAVAQLQNEKGHIFDVCIHGIEHPNKEWIEAKELQESHNCDGCCQDNILRNKDDGTD